MIGFLDESTAGRYRICLVLMSDFNHSSFLEFAPQLLLRGQSRFHMSKESPRRRKEILDRILEMPFPALIFEIDNKSLKPNTARSHLLIALGAHASWSSISKLIFDRSTSENLDTRVLLDLFQSTGHRLTFNHLQSSAEPGLWVSDSILWSYAKGGEWRRTVMSRIKVFRVH
jgi:hypothetical protein